MIDEIELLLVEGCSTRIWRVEALARGKAFGIL